MEKLRNKNKQDWYTKYVLDSDKKKEESEQKEDANVEDSEDILYEGIVYF